MANKNKLIPTWLKIAAVAALIVPYNVKVDKDENARLKKLSARSIAAKVTYTPACDGKDSDLTVVIPGITADKNGNDSKGKTFVVDKEKIVGNAKRAYANASEKVSVYAKKAAEGVKTAMAKTTAEGDEIEILDVNDIEDELDDICDALEESTDEIKDKADKIIF